MITPDPSQRHKPKLIFFIITCVLFLGCFYSAALGLVKMLDVNAAFISGIQTVGTVTQVTTNLKSGGYGYHIQYTDRKGNTQIGKGTDARPYIQGQKIPIVYNPSVPQTVYHGDAYLYWISYGALYFVLALFLSLLGWGALILAYPEQQKLTVLHTFKKLNVVGFVLAIMLTGVSYLSGKWWI